MTDQVEAPVPVVSELAGPVEDGWEISFAGWKVKDKNAFLKMMRVDVPLDEGDAVFFPWCAKMIKRWPYQYDPTDVAAYEELELSQYKEVVKRVTEAIKSAF